MTYHPSLEMDIYSMGLNPLRILIDKQGIWKYFGMLLRFEGIILFIWKILYDMIIIIQWLIDNNYTVATVNVLKCWT